MNSANLAKANRVRAQLERGIIAATPVPFSSDGKVHAAANASYMNYIASQPLAGVAVWAHTGRGLMIDNETAREVLGGWRTNLPDKLVIAGVGAGENIKKEQATQRTMEMAESAAALEADALLVYPPTWLREHEYSDELIVEHHQR